MLHTKPLVVSATRARNTQPIELPLQPLPAPPAQGTRSLQEAMLKCVGNREQGQKNHHAVGNSLAVQ